MADIKRHKEILCGEIDLSPIRLLGGFICIDTHFGCDGCGYCLNRRDPVLRDLLDRGVHLDLSDLGVTPEILAGIVKAMPSFHRARVPLRFGHFTDWRYERRETARILSFMPPDYPAVLMTRHPLDSAQCLTVKDHGNLIAHVTLTPRIEGSERWYVDPASVICSVEGLPRERVLFMLRPLVAGNGKECLRVIDMLPAGSNVAFKGISTDNIPGASYYRAVSEKEIEDLVSLARKRGMRVWDYFGCLLRENLRAPFFKYAEASGKVASACAWCSNRDLCGIEAEVDASMIARELERYGIKHLRLDVGKGRVHIQTAVPTARSEEIYLSELFKVDVRLSTVGRSEKKTVQPIGEELISRWEATGFFPVSILGQMASQVRCRIGN